MTKIISGFGGAWKIKNEKLSTLFIIFVCNMFARPPIIFEVVFVDVQPEVWWTKNGNENLVYTASLRIS